MFSFLKANLQSNMTDNNSLLPAFLCVINICSLISNQKHKTLFVQPLTLPLGNELMNTSFVNCISVPEALPSRKTKLAGAGQGCGVGGASFPSQKAVKGL